MNDLLHSPDKQDFDKNIKQELEKLEHRLRRPVLEGESVSSLFDRREVCQNIRLFAERAPEAAGLLSPLLVSVLHNELERSYRDTADKMFKFGISREIQTAVTRALAAISDPVLVDLYETSSRSIKYLINTLEQAAIDGYTKEARIAGVNALASISLSRPETVAKSVAIESIIPSIGTLLEAKAIDQREFGMRLFGTADSRRKAIRLLTVFDSYNSGISQKLAAIKKDLKHIQTDDLHCYLYAGILSDNITVIGEAQQAASLSDIQKEIDEYIIKVDTTVHERRRLAAAGLGIMAGSIESDDVIRSLAEMVQNAGSLDRRQEAAVLGEFVAACPSCIDIKVSHLVREVHNCTGRDRQRVARALGELTVVHFDGEDPLKELGLHILSDTGSGDQPLDAAALGEVVAVNPSTIEVNIQPLVNEIQSTSDWDRESAVKALGILAATSLVNNEDTIDQLVQMADPHSPFGKDIITGLGELAAANPDVVDLASVSLAQVVRTTTGKERLDAARMLGLVVAVGLDDHSSPPHILLERLKSDYHLHREIVLWAAGEVLAQNASSYNGIPESLVQDVKTTTGNDRRRAATSLGLILEAQIGCDKDIIQYLTAEERSLDIEVRAQAIGEVAATETSNIKAAPEAFVEKVHNFNGRDRCKTAQALGLLLLARKDSEMSDIEYLVNEFNEVGLESRDPRGEMYNPLRLSYSEYRATVARAIGELVAFDPESTNIDSPALIQEVQASTGDGRLEAARAVGLFVITNFEKNEASIEAVVEEVQTTAADWTAWWEPLALAELITVISDKYERVYQPLIDRIQDSNGWYRLLPARVLGEVIIAAQYTVRAPVVDVIDIVTEFTGHDRIWAVTTLGVLLAMQRQLERSKLLLLIIHWSSYQDSHRAVVKVVTKAIKNDIIDGDQMLTGLTSTISSNRWQGRTIFNHPRDYLQELPREIITDGPLWLQMNDPAIQNLLQFISTNLYNELEGDQFQIFCQQLQANISTNSGDSPIVTRLSVVQFLASLEETTSKHFYDI